MSDLLEMPEVTKAWRDGKTVQYFCVLGHDDEWTDYTQKLPPVEQPGRLVWRLKPQS